MRMHHSGLRVRDWGLSLTPLTTLGLSLESSKGSIEVCSEPSSHPIFKHYQSKSWAPVDRAAGRVGVARWWWW